MPNWTGATADASAAERATAFVVARVPGSPDVMKEIAVADMVAKDTNGNAAVLNAALQAGNADVVLIGRQSSAFPTGASSGFFRLRTNNNDATNGGISFDILIAGVATEAMRIDYNKRVGIGGVADAAATIKHTGTGEKSLTMYNTSWDRGLAFYADTSGYTLNSSNWTDGNPRDLQFATGGTVRGRFDASGNFLVGAAATLNGGRFHLNFTASNGAVLQTDSAATQFQMQFYISGTRVGTISTSGSATAYNTSSDYRLKDIDGPITNSGDFIDALNPVQGTWKSDGSRFIGLIAHEVQEVAETEIATGEKDGEEMQGMAYSAPELIAQMIAELKSLRARVAQLEAR
jgi:hypothetical protein